MAKAIKDDGFFEGQLLVAMPTMSDPRFKKSVILLCAHSPDGAMGIVLNKNLGLLSFNELLEQLDIPTPSQPSDQILHFGGPVETERGFVLHSTDQLHDNSMTVGNGIALTATIDMLKRVADGTGPQDSFLALGYAGWGPGQLEQEIQDNGWLVVDTDYELVFKEGMETMWSSAIGKLGFDPGLLSGDAGHA
ncbi:YqgE/AlgH family protein [Sneathiella chinensis]|uniref:UPF0301 protein GCM10007924_08980 n=1 Tax=Sneathiella chinensis TaxID=349750 RepID=A0ABQ5U0N7_9PROT|nr:YqgE/AlgH family protein [Sneathiella chinensis]GLQ05677.1 UPF0301 protein [Sneathiella chinensis]